MVQISDFPEVPPEQRATSELYLRYEDIAQDGRVMLLSLPHAFGTLWQKQLAHHPATRAAAFQGVIPILTRLVVDGGGGPVSVRKHVDVAGGFQLAHTVDAAGAVDRLMLNIFVELTGRIGRTQGPPPPRAGEPVALGRVLGEHVFTRPFAPPGQRKVLRFDLEGLPPVPAARTVFRPLDAVLELPAEATPLDPAPVPDEAPVVFGLVHTDSNQHVNSLVYPRLFVEAALRRLAAHGRSPVVLPRYAEVAYRKPCFAGDRARILLRAFATGDEIGAVGAFVPEGEPGGRPLCTLRVVFAS